MNISKLFEEKKTVFSLEVFPPKKTSSIDTIYSTLRGLSGFKADFVSVTYGAGGSQLQKDKTMEIASLIKKTYGHEALAHFTCLGTSKSDICGTLDKLKQNGIQNILALRGDRNPDLPQNTDFKYASDLVAFIKEYDSSFNIAGACYPEGHCESSSLEEDIANLKHKVDAGVSHLVTQLFFDNDVFYAFAERAAKAGINVPIEAGIMPITKKEQVQRTVSMCGASIPNKFSKMINRYSEDPEALRSAGIQFATEQIMDLLTNGVRGIHLYTMNNIEIAAEIDANVRDVINYNNK